MPQQEEKENNYPVNSFVMIVLQGCVTMTDQPAGRQAASQVMRKTN